MFAIAVVSREVAEAADCSARFGAWVTATDPGGRFFHPMLSEHTPWGWVGVAGAGEGVAEYVLHDGPRAVTRLFVHGLILDSDLLAALRSGQGDGSLVDRVRHADGQFVYAAIRCQPSPHFECGTDSLGMRPMYANDLAAPTVAANYSCLCGLLCDQLRLRPRTVLDFAIKDSVLPNDSVIDGVFRLNRGDTVHLDGARLVLRPCELGDLATTDTSEDKAADSVLRATKALADYPRVPLLGLTGGKDSRLMMALMLAAGVEFESATHHHPCKDTLVARELARSAGVVHWTIDRCRLDVTVALTRYLAMLPYSEGLCSMPEPDEGNTVHDLVAERGMIHVGGLGGEVLRAYWDGPEGGFTEPRQVIDYKFFQQKYDPIYPDSEALEQSREDWYRLVDNGRGVDEFVVSQVAYLDARLRGTISARTNMADYDYAWPLANRKLYHHALHRPRADRQEGNIFEEWIRRLAPDLLKVPWAAGAATYFGGKGLLAGIKRLRIRLGRLGALQRVRGKYHKTREKLRVSGRSSADRLLSAFLSCQGVREWIGQFVSPAGLELLYSGSPSFYSSVTAMFGLYHLDQFLKQLRSGGPGSPRDWRSGALNNIMESYEKA